MLRGGIYFTKCSAYSLFIIWADPSWCSLLINDTRKSQTFPQISDFYRDWASVCACVWGIILSTVEILILWILWTLFVLNCSSTWSLWSARVILWEYKSAGSRFCCQKLNMPLECQGVTFHTLCFSVSALSLHMPVLLNSQQINTKNTQGIKTQTRIQEQLSAITLQICQFYWSRSISFPPPQQQ